MELDSDKTELRLSPRSGLNPRVVLLTGGTGVIGQAIVERLANSGTTLYLGYGHDEERAEEIVRRFRGRCEVHRRLFDVSDPRATDDAVREIAGRHGRLDILVHAAGVMSQKALRFCTAEDVQSAFSVNTFGAIYCARAVIPYMNKCRWGRVVFIGSRSSTVGMKGFSLYTASKAALTGLCRSAAKEYAAMGITFNVVAPARVEGPHHRDESSDAGYPMGRLIRPDEVAALVAFLTSEQAATITGQTIVVDGASPL